MSKKIHLITTGAFAAFALAAFASPSSFAGRGLDSPIKYGDYGDTHVRYPGDARIPQGNIRTDGSAKGAYIEKCSWSLNNSVGKGFGLTQRCRRYTIENTQ